MMAVYVVSFELKADDTYSKRYNSFMEQLKKTTPWWAENTSCVIVSTTENIDEFCTRIYFSSEILDTKDRFLVLDANAKIGRVRGPIKDDDLFKLLPFVVKL
jgi:hypothetical protein